MTLLNVNKLCASYGDKEVVHDLSFTLREGEILGLVGESGSGKSTVLKSLWGHKEEGFKVNGEITKSTDYGLVFQNPYSSFNPTSKIKTHFYFMARSKTSMSKEEILARAKEILHFLAFDDVGHILNSYPYEMSGGMLQRISIGLACFLKPGFIIADEPTSALDTHTKKHTLEEIVKMKNEGISTLLVSHDIGVINKVCDRVMVLFHGRLIEAADAKIIMNEPIHPFTRSLISAVPKLGQNLVSAITYKDFDYTDLEKYLANPKPDHYVAPLRILYE
ncbi:ABC transporter ATP-binding protein [Anaerococcus murdochii]|uniref:ABC transporter ATP-binding protein n=1 Tax=Anaerococcus murdochii TaxID=411577 RepID=A0ABS7SZP8_9FIRM|nr:ABC transporter ATP-binding protein [Anaerococcus murdochii]MBZ2386995.1 ABC transporter ATP-binding protein [Anaerococcus murdochii]